MPPPAASVDLVWYSVDVASVHWITLSNYHPFTSSSAQYKWLQSDLASIDRSKTCVSSLCTQLPPAPSSHPVFFPCSPRSSPHVVVQSHAPWYNTNSAHQGDGEAQRKALESMLYNAGVDAVFAGLVSTPHLSRLPVTL